MTTDKKIVVSLEEIKDFIEDANYLVVIDSCVLLDYYRYSSKTAKTILNNLEFLKNYIWIPNQVFKEFHKNYNLVFRPSHNKYKNITKEVSAYTNELENKLNNLLKEYNKYHFPKVNELGEKISKHLKDIDKEATQYKIEIKKEMEDMDTLMRDNVMLSFVNQLKKDNKVGLPLSPKALLEIAIEGQQRFELNLPPGYKDTGKKDSKKGNIDIDPLAPYGDFIVWKSLIEKAKEDGVNIIFTTSDSKDDWWELDESKNILAPREELLAEFNEETKGKSEILMIPMKEFISNFSLLSNISSLYSTVELNAEDILTDRLYESDEEIRDTLINEAYHVHLGNIEDVEDFEIVNVNLENLDIEFDDEIVNITADFKIEASGYFIEYISREYSESTEITLTLKGSYLVEVELDVENEKYSIESSEITELNVVDSKVHYEEEIESWEYCDVCTKNFGDHELFPNKKICNSCSQSSEYILCTTCGTFYKHEDYTGDGQYCSKCLE